MIYKHKYKPRHYIPFITKSKLSLYKNSFLRGIYSIRSRQIKRSGNFKRIVMVATSRKWREIRRRFNPANKIAFKYTSLRSGSSTYGRPSIFKRRYRENFYKKQQFRLFYGKFKEDTLRIIIKNHKIVAIAQTSMFFSLLESRLDMMFFRRRLLPTIYSCHQFIHHFGLELNNKTENCPQRRVKVGDIITISPIFWRYIYTNLFERIYWRRWGMFVRGRRRLKKFKKMMYLVKQFTQKNKALYVKSQNKVPYSFKSFDFTEDLTLFTNRVLSHKEQVDTIANTKGKRNTQLDTWKKRVESVQISKLKIYQQLKLTSYLRKNYLPRIYRFFKLNGVKGQAQIERFNKRREQLHSKNVETQDKDNFFQYTKHIINNRKYLFRLKTKYIKKIKRKKKINRLKSVHFYIPKYRQIDYRTLSVIKVETQKESNIYFPFRISLNKVYAFYRSKGY